jgi:hypothetical protein
MPVNHARHSRGLCIGISDSPQAIAVFYLSTVGDYGSNMVYVVSRPALYIS